MRLTEKTKEMLRKGYICDHCLGRGAAELLSGMSNEQRGKVMRTYAAMLADSGEKLEIDSANFEGIKFRNIKVKPKKPKQQKKCKICKNFFLIEIDKVAKEVKKKLDKIEYDTFLVGSIVNGELVRAEERLWESAGIEFVEPIKSEINRELGKRIEKLTGKKFALRNPDVTITFDMTTDRIRLNVRSLYISGGYKKLARGISQTKWTCHSCNGKGCVKCKGIGKRFKYSVQEIIEKPFIKSAKAKNSKFHGAGREDVDARCLDYRPFVIELVRPMKRKISLTKMRKQINKSKKVNVSKLGYANKDEVRKIKFARHDKTYRAVVSFTKNIDGSKAKLIKQLSKATISQRTPTRVVHRRANLLRRRMVKKISYKLLTKKKMEVTVKGEAGLYIKELIAGDKKRTNPNIANIINNKVKKIELDVIKIHK